MGLKNWLIKKILKSNVTKSKNTDEEINKALEELKQTQNQAKKILKVKIINNEINKTLQSLNTLDDNEEDFEEDNGEEDFEETIKKQLLNKFLGNINNQNQNKPVATEEADLYNTKFEEQKPTTKGAKKTLMDALNKLPDDKAEELLKQYGGFLPK